jgi:hypothetical protein
MRVKQRFLVFLTFFTRALLFYFYRFTVTFNSLLPTFLLFFWETLGKLRFSTPDSYQLEVLGGPLGDDSGQTNGWITG